MGAWINRNIRHLNYLVSLGLNPLVDNLLQVDCLYSSIMAGCIEEEKQERSRRRGRGLPLLPQLCCSAIH